MFHDIIEKACDISFHIIYIRSFRVVCHTKFCLSTGASFIRPTSLYPYRPNY